MADKADIRRYRDNLQDETDATFMYRAIAAIEKQPQLAEVFTRMAAIEESHVGFWERKLTEAGISLPTRSPSIRARCMIVLARMLGPQMIMPSLADNEKTASRGYDSQPEVRGQAMPAEEKSHARVLSAITKSTAGEGMEGGILARLEGRHRAVGGNALRAAVLGANDGLVSTLSLVMGVAGGVANDSAGARTVALAGVAGMLAGACAMAMGEWLSVQSARELAEKQLSVEKAELADAPEEEMEELALIYQAKGLPKDEARELAQKLIADKGTALDTLAREELGLDPEELGGSAGEAAVASFILFLVGAISPVLPFLLIGRIHLAMVASLVLSTFALFGIGAAITLLTGKPLLKSGGRQLLIGLLAAAVTYGMGLLMGKLFGISVAG